MLDYICCHIFERLFNPVSVICFQDSNPIYLVDKGEYAPQEAPLGYIPVRPGRLISGHMYKYVITFMYELNIPLLSA